MANDGPDEVVYAVTGSVANATEPISLADAGLREQEHLQEWVIAHPEIIGPDVMIVTFEVDEWSSVHGGQKDHLDVLGLGQDGRIVVAGLKRGRAAGTIEMQALKYAAMASRFKAGLLAEYHAKFSQREMPSGAKRDPLTEAEALTKLESHSNGSLRPDQLINPRIVLLAESFLPSVSATAVWLNERGIDLTLVRYQTYRAGPGQIILTVSQLYPVHEVADFGVIPPASAKPSASVIDVPETSRSGETRPDQPSVAVGSSESRTMLPFNDITNRDKTRICFIYGLKPRITGEYKSQCIGNIYDFGRLAGHIKSGGTLLPRVIMNERFTASDLEDYQISGIPFFPTMETLRVVVTVTPRGDPILIIDSEINEPASPIGMAELLAATCFERSKMCVNDVPLTKWLVNKFAEAGIELDSLDFGSDVHQCVFPGTSLRELLYARQDSSAIDKTMSQILYRGTLPVDSGSLTGIYKPPGLNHPGSTIAAHGRGVSLFAGWTIHLEHAFMLTAVSTVSALGALRLTRHEAFGAMALAQNATLAADSRGRSLVSQLSDRLNEMQLDLSFGVETHIDSVLIPEMVVESFQRSLSEAVGIRDSLDNTSRMLQRVGTVISVRLSKLEAADRERSENRDRLVAVLVAVASLLALPPALLLAFFGVNARQVDPAKSIFDFHAYWGAYALAWLPFVILVSVGSLMYSRIRRRGVSQELSSGRKRKSGRGRKVNSGTRSAG
jgi:hypothetical protein